MKWKIWYGDRSTFSNRDGEPQDAPGRNLQAIAQEDEQTGYSVARSNDFYWWSDGWQGGDLFGLWDYLQEPGLKVVKFGRTVSNREFQRILREIAADTYLPPKSARHEWERKP